VEGVIEALPRLATFHHVADARPGLFWELTPPTSPAKAFPTDG
jgi:hypothetical protein